jgi:MFS family permease
MDTSPQNPRLGIILTVMTLSHTIASFCNLSIPSLTPFLRDEMHLTHAQVGMLMSFFYFGVVSASIFFGWTTDLLGELVRKELVGQATGFSLTITFLGIIFFPPLFGYIVDRFGTYTRAWDMLAVSWLVALFILIFFVQENKMNK